MFVQFRSSAVIPIYRQRNLTCRHGDILEVGQGLGKITQDVAIYLLESYPKNFFRVLEEPIPPQASTDVNLEEVPKETPEESSPVLSEEEQQTDEEDQEESSGLTDEAKEVLEAMGDQAMKPGEIAGLMNTQWQSIARTLSFLVSEKYIERDNDGYYSVVEM